MKQIIALALVLCLVGGLVACTEVTRISVERPAKLMVEKAGGSVAITLTDPKTVSRITDVVCQVPLQEADAKNESWSYRLTWQDENDKTITTITLAGSQILWNGATYGLSIGVDLSVITDPLEKILESLPMP